MVLGGGGTVHNGPVAAGALGGLVLAAAAYVHVSRPGLNGAWLRAVTKVCAVLGIINLAAGISMRIFVYEDKRMAGRAVTWHPTDALHPRSYTRSPRL
jgi:hypothetical protein